MDLARPYDIGEIVADAVVHGIGIVLALIGAVVLVWHTALWSSPGGFLAACVYGFGLVLCLSVSLAYNMWPATPLRDVLRRLDHAAIFVLIAATYTPFLQAGAEDARILVMLAAIWALAFAGILLKCAFPGRLEKLAVLLYLALGWSGVVIAGPLSHYLPPVTLWLIVIGGLIYSLGVIFHLSPGLRFQNAIWHGFVVAAAAVHYAAVVTRFRF